jgi:hypothetical protein
MFQMKVKILDTTGKYSVLAEKLVSVRGGAVTTDGNFDVLVAFLDNESTAAGFQIAEAAERQRYVLVLLPEGQKSGVREESKFLTVKNYTPESVERILKEYLDHRRRGNLKRFNFVIPRELVDYLQWVPRGRGVSKSDFVRDLIQKELSQDEKYKSLNNHE